MNKLVPDFAPKKVHFHRFKRLAATTVTHLLNINENLYVIPGFQLNTTFENPPIHSELINLVECSFSEL